jgi:hypothetical protein
MLITEYITMDPVIITVFLEQASAATQVTMSMICKQWVAVARAYSLRYRTIGQAVYADSSIAISRLLADGRVFDGGDLSRLSKTVKYLEKGNSIDFARAVDHKVVSYIPYCFVKTRGTKYVRWLEENKRLPKTYKPSIIDGIVRGDPQMVAKMRDRVHRLPEIAAILIMNGHKSMCWKLEEQEIRTILRLHKWIDTDTLLEICKQGAVPMYSIPHGLIVRFYTEYQWIPTMQIRAGIYFCKSREQAEKLTEVTDTDMALICTAQGVYGGNIARESVAVEIFSRTQNFSVFEGIMITGYHFGVRILPENVELVEGIIQPHCRLICVSCHEFSIYPNRAC